MYNRSGFERNAFKDVFRSLRDCDIAIEVVDARDVGGTRITRLDRTFTSKLIIVAAKKDTMRGVQLPPTTIEGYPIYYLSTKTMEGKVEFMGRLHEMADEILGRRQSRRDHSREKRLVKKGPSPYNAPTSERAAKEQRARAANNGNGLLPDELVKVMVFGIPNVGKSSVINMIANRRAAAAGFKAGVTKGPQWIRLSKNLLLCDSPGVVAMRQTKEELALKSAFDIEKLADPEAVAEELIRKFWTERSRGLERFYKIEMSSSAEEVLERIAIARHFVKKGGEPDVQRTIYVLLRDFQKGKFVL